MSAASAAAAASPQAALTVPAVSRDRWYVLGLLTVVYAVNIADRFSI